jgi:stage II sporulation protein R
MRRLGCHFFSRGKKVVLILFVSVLFAASFTSFIGTAYAASRDARLIPDEAIRIRILAHSDAAFDQQVKQEVRGRVEDVILSWGPMPETYEEAHALISSRLGEIQSAADQALEELGAPYSAAVELGKFPFPEKSFAGTAYEAGDYEALRITLGGGSGSNWWCVLFPPLCITAAVAQDPAAKAQVSGPADSAEQLSEDGQAGGDSESADDRPKPRFFLWEMLKKLGHLLNALLS